MRIDKCSGGYLGEKDCNERVRMVWDAQAAAAGWCRPLTRLLNSPGRRSANYNSQFLTFYSGSDLEAGLLMSPGEKSWWVVFSLLHLLKSLRVMLTSAHLKNPNFKSF